MKTLHGFVFGVYPYICLTVFLLGSLIRFDRDQYTWKSDSSQMLRTGLLRTRSDPAGGASAGKRLLHTLAVLMTN